MFSSHWKMDQTWRAFTSWSQHFANIHTSDKACPLVFVFRISAAETHEKHQKQVLKTESPSLKTLCIFCIVSSHQPHPTLGETRQRPKHSNKIKKSEASEKPVFSHKICLIQISTVRLKMFCFGVCGAVVSKHQIKCFLMSSTAHSLVCKFTGCSCSRRLQLKLSHH